MFRFGYPIDGRCPNSGEKDMGLYSTKYSSNSAENQVSYRKTQEIYFAVTYNRILNQINECNTKYQNFSKCLSNYFYPSGFCIAQNWYDIFNCYPKCHFLCFLDKSKVKFRPQNTRTFPHSQTVCFSYLNTVVRSR